MPSSWPSPPLQLHTPRTLPSSTPFAQQPSQPNNVLLGSNAERELRSYIEADGKLHWPTLPHFSAQWRDVHDILEAWRDWDGIRASGEGHNSTASTTNSSGYEYDIELHTT